MVFKRGLYTRFLHTRLLTFSLSAVMLFFVSDAFRKSPSIKRRVLMSINTLVVITYIASIKLYQLDRQY